MVYCSIAAFYPSMYMYDINIKHMRMCHLDHRPSVACTVRCSGTSTKHGPFGSRVQTPDSTFQISPRKQPNMSNAYIVRAADVSRSCSCRELIHFRLSITLASWRKRLALSISALFVRNFVWSEMRYQPWVLSSPVWPNRRLDIIVMVICLILNRLSKAVEKSWLMLEQYRWERELCKHSTETRWTTAELQEGV